MQYISLYNNYDKEPEKKISCPKGSSCEGYETICHYIREKRSGGGRFVVVVDCYPGVDMVELAQGLAGLGADEVIYSDDCFLEPEAFTARIRDNLTDDRVFGRMTCRRLEDFLEPLTVTAVRERIRAAGGLVLVMGVGASLLWEPDLLVYADLARWEIQTRYKAGAPNWRSDNPDDPFLAKYKRGFFVIWRLADRHKRDLFDKIDFLLDTNRKGEPKMATGAAFRQALETFASQPFRLVPYFDPGVWGGQWMKGMLNLPDGPDNYAWSFDGVPEENSLYARIDGVRLEFPAMDLVLYRPARLLGERVYGRFGAEFPIRFDFLDTMGGGNLSLQVHPLTSYIQETFGMHYTQDESYYILAAEEDACVYLGLREGIDPAAMAADLRRAQAGEIAFPAEKYVNKFPAKTHDHFLIPAGTVHCSGRNAMVLEISATPYIFT
ncbi:MAG: mannose-6-phosphate isomerase, partial [Clostridiales bacterium]|nr:mannose-6-phosphate isomerase [Clostridiales bacterium]